METTPQNFNKEILKKEKNVFTFISLCDKMYLVKIGNCSKKFPKTHL